MISFKEYVNEIKSRFSDSIESTPEIQADNLIFNLCGKQIEFKPENEINSNGIPYFTYEEALACQKDRWRLPTREEFKALIETGFVFGRGKGIFDGRLVLPAMGYRDHYDHTKVNIGDVGYYWSSKPDNPDDIRYLTFHSEGAYMRRENQNDYSQDGHSVRLVREV